jgi:putative effector of murein hydrolase LrgA (UPF0299 family)
MIVRWLGFSGLYILLALLSFHTRDSWSLSTTLWLPAPLLFATLWLTPVRYWPLWLASAGLIHTAVGVWTGRPLSLASLFALNDILFFPLGVVAFRYSRELSWLPLTRSPIGRELIYTLQLTFCAFCGSALLNFSLLLAGYPIAPLHIFSWALAALTGVLAILPFLRERTISAPRQLFRDRQEAIILILNIILMPALYLALPGHWQGLHLLFVQLTLLLLSVFALSGRSLSLLLLIQSPIVVLATQQREGIFFSLTPASIPAIWQAQCYLVFTALLVNCLHQYQASILRQQAQTAAINWLIARFSLTGTCLLFHLRMPTETLYWCGSTESLFPDETHTIGSLALLDAHCESPFLADFHAWCHHQNDRSFERDISLQKLNGERVRCLLAIQRTRDETLLIGGLSLYQE